jgi:hypothetical protein
MGVEPAGDHTGAATMSVYGHQGAAGSALHDDRG